MLLMLLAAATPAFADVTVEFGSERGRVGYINQKTNPGEEVFDIGPRSFRVIGNEVWVADTVGNKLIKFDKAGGLIEEFSFAGAEEKLLVEDFAPVFAADGSLQYFWLIDAYGSSLLKITPDGKKLDEIKSADLLQPMRIEVDSEQNLYVADDGSQKILIFAPDKSLTAQIEYEWSGLALTSEKGIFYRLKYDAAKQQTSLLKQTTTGQEAQAMPVNLEKHHNPHLWWVDSDKQEFVITYQSEKIEKGKAILARCAFDSSIKGSIEITLPISMTRFIDHQNFTEIWLGAGNYREAPAGNLNIKVISLP